MKQDNNKSQTITEIAKALAQFQSECPVLEKGSQGYGYKYADLPYIIATITPILQKCGLCFTQLPSSQESYISVTTILVHVESGEFFETTISSDVTKNKGNMSLIQATGSIITYLRRYSISSILGIVTDEDIDGYVKQPSINDLIEQAKLCTTVDQLKEFWDKHEEFQKERTFSTFVKARRETLEKNNDSSSK